MGKEEVKHIIDGFLIDEFEIEESLLEPSATWKDLGLDSLDFVDIVVIIERNFGFKVKGEEMARIKTLNEFYDYIHNRQKIKV